jgi:hypothetical protein
MSGDPSNETKAMIDLIFVAAAASFFALAITYAHFCEKLRGGGHD